MSGTNENLVASNATGGWDSLTKFAIGGQPNPDAWSELENLANECEADGENADRDAERKRIEAEYKRLADGDIDDEAAAKEIAKKILDGGWLNDDEFLESLGDDVDMLIDLGLSVDKVLGNKKVYDSIASNEYALSFPTGWLGELYDKMAKDPDGKKKFVDDFGKRLSRNRWTVGNIVNGLLNGDVDDVNHAVGDLMAFEACGVPVLGHQLKKRTELADSYAMSDEDRELAYEVTKNLVSDLVNRGVVGQRDLSAVYNDVLERRINIDEARGALDAMLELGVEPMKGDTFGAYWSKLQKEKGKNVLMDLLDDKYDDVDFRDMPAFDVALRRKVYHREQLLVESNFSEALASDEIKQDAVLAQMAQKLDFARENGTGSSYGERGAGELFELLAHNRDILDSMRGRKAFEAFPEFSELNGIGKFVRGDYTEKDRLSLFLGYHGDIKDDFFDENGEPNGNFYSNIAKDYYDLSHSVIRELSSRRYYFDSDEKEKLCAYLAEREFLLGGRGWDRPQFVDSDGVPEFFDESGPKPEFWRAAFDAGAYGYFSSQSEEALEKMELTGEEVAFLKASRNPMLDLYFHIKPGEIPKYFNESGPKPEFWRAALYAGDYNFLASQDEETKAKMGLTDAEIIFIDMDEELRWIVGDILRGRFGEEYITKLDGESMKNIANLSRMATLSNSEEISGHAARFMKPFVQILFEKGVEFATEEFRNVEEIFIKNNLPYVGKVFRTFRFLYPEVLDRGSLKGLPEDGLRSKSTILFNELLKASVGSNNRDLRWYLKDLQYGQSLAERLRGGETDFSVDEEDGLARYAAHLRMLYDNTEQGRQNPIELSGDSIDDVRRLSALFSPNERYSVPDRVVRSFGFGLGVKSCQEMIDRMDVAVKEADARNRRAAEARHFTLESGDLIKSTGIEYLGNILQNGSVSKEFLNGEKESDSTPFDTDLNILPAGLSGNISDGVDKKNDVAAFGRMHCMMVMEGDGRSGRKRFQIEGEGRYDPNLYEVWHNSGDNYGIMVGFPSTEIDYLIYDSIGSTVDSYGNLAQMKFEVVRNGFYIPIVDKKTGDLVFSPADYDLMAQKMNGLLHYGMDNNYLFAEDMTVPGMDEIMASSDNNREEVDKKRSAIIDQVINPVLEKFNLNFKGYLDGDLTEGSAEVIDTGSTGRYANAPGDGDFDFMMKLDKQIIGNEVRMQEFRGALCDALGLEGEARARAIVNGNFRVKGVSLKGLDMPVDIDITFKQKTNKVRYSTDMALKEYYEAMERVSPEKAAMAKANVVFAKKFLKEIGVYKGKNSRGEDNRVVGELGGLGGVGIENWIVQNGGSFVSAAKEFMSAAKDSPGLDVFKSKYAIFDFGENHYSGKHDNFVVNNLGTLGYGKMKEALGKFLDDNGVSY